MAVLPPCYHESMAMTVRPDEAMKQALDQLSSAMRVSKAEVVRVAVLEKWQRDQHLARVRTAGVEVIKRRSALLDRLSET